MRLAGFSRKSLALTFGLCMAVSGTAAAQTISNLNNWQDGTWARYWEYGSLNYHSWAQTFTAPNVRLPSFTFVTKRDNGEGNFNYNAGIYAFNDNKISGPPPGNRPGWLDERNRKLKYTGDAHLRWHRAHARATLCRGVEQSRRDSLR